MSDAHKPLGWVKMVAMVFFAIVAIVLIGHGINDIRNGEGAGFWFFVGWVAAIAAFIIYILTPRKPKGPSGPAGPTGGAYAHLLLPMQVLSDTGPVGTPMLSDSSGLTLLYWLIGITVVVLVGIGIKNYLHDRKGTRS